MQIQRQPLVAEEFAIEGVAANQPGAICIEQDRVEEMRKVRTLINSPALLKPSNVAGLPPESVGGNLTVQLVDNAFITALEDYKRTFITAAALDLGRSLSPRDAKQDFIIALVTGGANFAAKYTPNIPVIKHIVGPILLFIGGVIGILKKEGIIKQVVLEEASNHRKRWLESVLVKEELRIRQSVESINWRARNIIRDIEAMGELVDGDLVHELRTLDTLKVTLTPGSPLVLNNVPVLKYLRSRGIE